MDLVKIWKLLPTNNPLVKLAILVLSFVPNSASVERLFSKLGDIKTKKRNRMGTKKLRDTAYIKSDLHCRHAKEGTAKWHLKRQFGHVEVDVNNHMSTNQVEDEEVLRDAEDPQEKSGLESEGDSEMEDDDDDRAQPFTRIARDLEAAAQADSDD
jgi:hypothetical protein